MPLGFTPVPLTGQTLGVLAVGMALGARLGGLAALTYLLEGAAGLPVWSPGSTFGIARLVGPTGGYLVGFVVAAFLVGWLAPDIAESPWMKALGDGFIKLIKMAIAPIIFCTVVSGIAHIEDASKVGRVGVKALVYFEIVSTLALAIGLLVGNFVRPGDGFSGAAGDAAAVAQYADPYRQIAARELEMNPESVDLNDPRFRKMLDQVNSKGERVAMTLSESAEYLRKLSEWQQTRGANEKAATLTENILKTFGAVA